VTGSPPGASSASRHTAAYRVRNPLSLKKLVYLDGQKAVLYRSKMKPFLGRNFETLEPLEWLARMSDHIPDPGQHRTLFYGVYSNRARRLRRSGPCEKRRAAAAKALLAMLGHGLSTPEAEKPPPLREVLRVAQHHEGWGVPAEWSDPNPSLTAPA
jgi:Putative transposase